MAETFETKSVTIDKRRYDELLKKEFAFDVYGPMVKADKYATEFEKALFLSEKEKLKEIPAEEWEAIVALVNEQEEENAETV